MSLLYPEQMTPADRAAAQSWQTAISQSAQLYGYTLDSSYAYREIACPVAPKHLLLAYEAASPSGSVSRFTAVVFRGAEEETAGHHPVAQIIPILHFGITPFVPAIANTHSVEIFNAAVTPAPPAVGVLKQMQAGNDPLLVRALCYLAMVGEEPAALRSPSLDSATIHAPVPTLQFLNRGKNRQLISVRSSPSTYQVWALTFSSSGRLLSATREQHPIDRTTPMLDGSTAGSPQPPPVSTNSWQPSTAPAPAPPAASVTAAPALAVTPPPAVPTTAISEPLTAAAIPAMPSATPVNAPLASASSAVPPSEPKGQPVPPSMATVSTPPPNPALAVPRVSVPATVNPSAVENSRPSSDPAAVLAAESLATTPPSMSPPPGTRPPLPSPPSRFIPNPPPPPSRFIPASALQTPPHLPQ